MHLNLIQIDLNNEKILYLTKQEVQDKVGSMSVWSVSQLCVTSGLRSFYLSELPSLGCSVGSALRLAPFMVFR